MKAFGSAKTTSWLAAAAALLVTLGVTISYQRGTTLAPPVAPASVSDGARCGLIAKHRVRCLALADASVDTVWRLITDYPRFPELFRSRLFELTLSKHAEQSSGRWRLVGAVSGLTRRWPFEIEVTHQRESSQSRASWERLSGVLSTNRGGWWLERRSATQTLITYEIELAQPGLPAFVINDVLLDNLPGGLEHLVDAASKGTP
jgi:uncharacterized membrane protein